MLGASTKHVADPRSVQSLVDFSRGNLGWLQPEHTEILKRKRSSMSTDPTDSEGGSRVLNQSPSGVFRRPFLGLGEDDRGPVVGIPIDPDLNASGTYSMGDCSTSTDSLDPNTNTDNAVGSLGGNGQYTSNDSSSVTLVERVHFPSISSLVRYDTNETL